MGQLDYSSFDAVQVGSIVMGWVGPTRANRENSFLNADVTLVMGDSEFQLDVTSYAWGYLHLGSDDTAAKTINKLSYAKRLVVPVPVGSVDISPKGELDYTPRTLETITATLHNFFIAFAGQVKASLHILTPVEVVRKLATLSYENYPIPSVDGFAWRGTLLSDMVQDTSMRVRAVKMSSSRGTTRSTSRGRSSGSSYGGYWRIQELPRVLPPDSLLSTGFGRFVDWQVRSNNNPARALPENVFHLRANSLEEYNLGNNLILNRGLLERYLFERMPNIQDAAFFLSMAGDPLEEWVDGESFGVRDFQTATSF